MAYTTRWGPKTFTAVVAAAVLGVPASAPGAPQYAPTEHVNDATAGYSVPDDVRQAARQAPDYAPFEQANDAVGGYSVPGEARQAADEAPDYAPFEQANDAVGGYRVPGEARQAADEVRRGAEERLDDDALAELEEIVDDAERLIRDLR